MNISYEDLESLALGAALLGSGGGGDPSSDLLMAKDLFESHRQLKMVPLDQIPDDALILATAYMGAPLVSIEKLPSYGEWKKAQELIERAIGKPLWGVAAGEIGGSNALAPIIAATECGVHLIDADTLGRAFPCVHMSSCALRGVSPSPAALVDGYLNGAVIDCQTPKSLERLARSLVPAMGSSAAAMIYPMTGRQARSALISGSMSRAITLGRALQKSESLQEFLSGISESFRTKHIGQGVIVDIVQHIEDGFLTGAVSIQDNAEILKLDLQNEYLVVRRGDQVVGTTPDIIALLESNSLKPIASDQLRYGLTVDVVVLSSPDIWKSPEGLALTGPAAFGYTFKEKVYL